MKVEHMRYFLETVSSRSINQASKKLLLNHQYLGQILDAIERELGVKLLNRNRSGIELTTSGQKAVPIIEEIVTKYDELQRILEDSQAFQTKSLLNIYMTQNLEPVYLLRAVDDMQVQNPNIDVIVRECSTEDILQQIKEQDMSIGLMAVLDNDWKMLEQLDDEYTVIALKKWPISALVHKDSPLVKKYKSISLKTVLKYDVVLYTPNQDLETPAWRTLKLGNANKDPLIKCTTNNLHVFHDRMKKEKSITIGVERDSLTSNELVAIPLRNKVSVTSTVVLNKNETNDLIIQHFVDLLKKAYI